MCKEFTGLETGQKLKYNGKLVEVLGFGDDKFQVRFRIGGTKKWIDKVEYLEHPERFSPIENSSPVTCYQVEEAPKRRGRPPKEAEPVPESTFAIRAHAQVEADIQKFLGIKARIMEALEDETFFADEDAVEYAALIAKYAELIAKYDA